ncbi:unnamed protein product [Lactuca virosa]|uniref:Uncharacterized protein n=1 Tax=Lactuca virosa TaxID=75947 RepID=A0AAU9MXW7_9ASTR|nr:unnamed protein product [Lactuca virosa]
MPCVLYVVFRRSGAGRGSVSAPNHTLLFLHRLPRFSIVTISCLLLPEKHRRASASTVMDERGCSGSGSRRGGGKNWWSRGGSVMLNRRKRKQNQQLGVSIVVQIDRHDGGKRERLGRQQRRKRNREINE